MLLNINRHILYVQLLLVITFCTSYTLSGQTGNSKWVGTWATAPQLVEPHNNPPDPGLSNNTVRQVIRVSIGGDSIRLRFSNEFSKAEVTIASARVALSAGNGAVVPGSSREITFNNSSDFTMQPGTAVTSDPLAFPLQPRTDIAITIFFGETSPDVTGHPGSRTTSYIIQGNHIDEDSLPGAVTTDHWYVINGIDVVAPESAGAVVVLGNSITDGRGSGTNKQNRWPDILAERLKDNPVTKNIAVLNMGIGGNCVLRNCLGPAAVDRFERDVLNQNGVKWLIILEGINDIGGVRGSESADKTTAALIEAFGKMIDKAHAKNIKVYGATLLPFGGSDYYKGDPDNREKTRAAVNNWIRNSGRFDAVIDLEAAMRDPENPLNMLSAADTGDHLHPNENGHRMMGEAVNLDLFK